MHRCLMVTTLLLSGTAGAFAQELGAVDFPTSANEAAQRHFIRGVLLLHSFEYPDAREVFQQARQTQPDFAMAYWGEAMTHNRPIWNQQDLEEARAVLSRLGDSSEDRLAKAPTEREKDYLRTLEVLYGEGSKSERDLKYAEAMRRLAEKHPEDLEAASFYALALLGTTGGKRDFRTYMRAAAVVEEVFARNPRHPGAAHYLIHAYDDPIHAPLGLRPARVYAEIAPAAPHALHMPSHIFVALGMWNRAADSNLASWKAAKGGIHGYHALWWLQYAYLQQGRFKEARELLDLIYRDAGESGESRAVTHLARMRGAYLVETRRCGDQDVLAMPVEVEKLRPGLAANHWFTEAFCALRHNNREAATAVLEKLATLAEEDPSPEVEIPWLEARAAVAWSQGEQEDAIRWVAAAAALQDDMPYDFGPPLPFKPPHEMLGEMYLEQGDSAAALGEFEKSLERAPRRVLSLSGAAQAADAMGEAMKARELYEEMRSIWRRADQPLPEWTALKESNEKGKN